MICIQLS